MSDEVVNAFINQSPTKSSTLLRRKFYNLVVSALQNKTVKE